MFRISEFLQAKTFTKILNLWFLEKSYKTWYLNSVLLQENNKLEIRYSCSFGMEQSFSSLPQPCHSLLYQTFSPCHLYQLHRCLDTYIYDSLKTLLSKFLFSFPLLIIYLYSFSFLFLYPPSFFFSPSLCLSLPPPLNVHKFVYHQISWNSENSWN